MRSLLQKPIFWAIFLILITSLFIFLTFLVTRNKNQPLITKKPGSCFILEEIFCSQAEVINWKNPQGKTVTIIGINLPPGTPIFSPMDGQGTGTKLDGKGVFKGSYITVFNPEKPDDTRLIITADASNLTKTDTKKGDIIGKVENTGIENLGYNVIVYATRVIDPKTKEAVVEKQYLKKLFPKIKL